MRAPLKMSGAPLCMLVVSFESRGLYLSSIFKFHVLVVFLEVCVSCGGGSCSGAGGFLLVRVCVVIYIDCRCFFAPEMRQDTWAKRVQITFCSTSAMPSAASPSAGEVRTHCPYCAFQCGMLLAVGGEGRRYGPRRSAVPREPGADVHQGVQLGAAPRRSRSHHCPAPQDA